MYWQRARHPRVGVAIGLAILGTWLGALGLALATSAPVDGQRTAFAGADSVETAQTGPTTPTEFRTK